MKMRCFLKVDMWMSIGLAILLVTLAFPISVLAASTSPVATSEAYSAETMGISEENRTVDDVTAAFDALTHHGEWLGFHMGEAPDTSPCPTDEHIQGIARSPQTGKPIFYVTRSGNVHDEDYYGSLMVVEMGSRDTDGERLRSNRLFSDHETRTSRPPGGDKVIKNISYDSWEHPGGIQMVGDILAVPLEGPPGGFERSKVIFYDCSDPKNPVKLDYELSFTYHKAGVVGITKLPDGHFFMIVTWGDNAVVQFYRSNETSFFAPGFKFKGHPESLENFQDLTADGYWPTGGSRGQYPFQTLNFINQTDGKLFLIASRCSDSWAPSSAHHGDDLMYLIQVTGFGEGKTVEFTGIRKFIQKHLSSDGCWNTWGGEVCSGKPMIVSENIQANFNAGAGAYISPSGELLYYATSHFNKGPDNTIKMAELRHNWVSISGTCGPQFLDNHLGGPYTIAEGSSITINGEAFIDGPCMKPWVQMFADGDFQGTMVMMDFDDQYSDDYNDFPKLDGCRFPAPDGFNDALDSFRFCGPKGSTLYLFDDDNYRVGNTNYSPVPGTGKVITDAYVGPDFHDEATSAIIDWDGYSSQPYSWDLDNDGEYDDAFGPTATFQAGSWSSTNVVRMKYAYNDTEDPASDPEYSDIFETTINVVNVPPTVEAGPDLTIRSGDTVYVNATFTDPGILDTHTATIDWGDGTPAEPAEVSESNGSGTVTGTHIYYVPRDYTVIVEVTDDEGESGCDSLTATVSYVPVIIDIKPGSDTNSINPDSKGVIPVAILTNGDFDATTVRGDTCRFGPGEAAPRHYAIEDVDSDGDQDMILHFPTGETGLSFGDTEATLTGQDTDGRYIMGTDMLRTVPPKGKKD
jgi:hypothetical protein